MDTSDFSEPSISGDESSNEELERHASQTSGVQLEVSVSKRIPFAPKVTRAGDFYTEEAMSDKRDLACIASNLSRLQNVLGFNDESLGSHATRAFVTLVLPVAHVMWELLNEAYFAATGKPLTDGEVMQFIIALMVMSSHNYSPTQYFNHRKFRPHGEDIVYSPDPISSETFAALFRLLDGTKPSAGCTRTNQKSKLVGKVVEAVQTSLQRLMNGIPTKDGLIGLCLDDVVVSARSGDMNEKGWAVKSNPKKAAKSGVTIDVMTFSIARVVTGIILFDSDDKKNENRRSTLIAQMFNNLIGKLGVRASHFLCCMDRGYEAEAYALAANGARIIATSQKGFAGRKSTPFTHDVTRVSNLIEVIPYKRPLIVRRGIWRENAVNGKKFFHVAYVVRSNKAPVYLKTTEEDLANYWIAVPGVRTLSIVKDELRRRSSGVGSVQSLLEAEDIQGDPESDEEVEDYLETSNEGQHAPVAVATGTTPEPLSSVTSELPSSDRSQFDVESHAAIVEDVRRSCFQLSASQKTGLWFLQRTGAITSTALPDILTWFRACWESALLTNQPRPMLSALSVLVPQEPTPSGTQHSPSLDEEGAASAQQHLDYLLRLEGASSPTIDPKLLAAIGVDASVSDLLNAARTLKLTIPRKSVLTDVERQTLRTEVNAEITNRVKKLKTNLAARLCMRWSSSWKGNESTKVGERGESWLLGHQKQLLHSALEAATFVDAEGDLVLNTPFAKVGSRAFLTGCVAPTVNSHCVASTDGFIGACAADSTQCIRTWLVEVKTKTTLASVKGAYKPDNRIFNLSSETSLDDLAMFRSYCVEPAYALQVIHHAATSGINRAVLVFVDGSGESFRILRFVAVRFAQDLLGSHRRFIDFVTRTFLPVLQSETMLDWGSSDAKGGKTTFAADSLNELRKLRLAFGEADERYVDDGVMPSIVHIYNRMKSGSDVLHRQMRSVPTSNVGTARKLILAVLEMLTVSARQAYGASLVASNMGDYATREQMMDRMNNAKGSLTDLAKDISMSFSRKNFNLPMPLKRTPELITPSTEPVINPHWVPHDPNFKGKLLAKRSNPASVIPANYNKKGLSDIASAFVVDPGLNAMRTNTWVDMVHEQKCDKPMTVGGNQTLSRSRRMHCDLCCMHCEQGAASCATRFGYNTTNRCSLCGVYLCTVGRKIWGGQSCWQVWHGAETLPGSHPFLLGSDGIATMTTTTTKKVTAKMSAEVTTTTTTKSTCIPLAVETQARLATSITPQNHKSKRKRQRQDTATTDQDDATDDMTLTSLEPIPLSFTSSSTKKRGGEKG